MRYRAEIDGLRALAVIPVILFHAGFKSFSGGFVGVDVFFVISGYLITSILIAELEAGEFSIARFYERRARRILPALFFVILVCIPFAWLWMPPKFFSDFALSVAATALFASNLLFWSQEGYFAVEAELKPLLHTWSLAVEEQYYLLFPLFLMATWRFSRARVFWALLAVAAASLALSEWASHNAPEANFYLTPMRIWELLAGSLCAFLSAGRSLKPNEPASAVGLALILSAIFLYDGETPFPGLYAAPPVLGAALVLLYAGPGTLAGRLLSTKPFVGIGLISYSAYLWHQPLFALAKIRLMEVPGPPIMAALSASALVLAWGTWRWVEQPFRKGAPLLGLPPSRRAALLAGGYASLGFAALGVVLKETPPFMQIRNPELFVQYDMQKARGTACPDFEAIGVGDGACHSYGKGERRIVIWGDSHAESLAQGMTPPEGFSVVVLSHNGCPPAIGVRRSDRTGNWRNCEYTDTTSTYLEYINAMRPEVVVLVARWALYQNGIRNGHLLTDNPELGEGPSATISAAALHRGLEGALNKLEPSARKILVSPPADLFFFSRNIVTWLESIDASSSISGWHKNEDELMNYMNNKYGFTVVNTRDIFCSYGICELKRNGLPLYLDGNHLSPYGSIFQWEAVNKEIVKFIL